jgi:dipeptidyl aminopeptidase/acylaminoacyl peptidase
LLFTKEGALWAQRLNVAAAGLQGELLPVAPRVAVDISTNGYGAVSASATGSIAYRPAVETKQLVWLDRAGRPSGALGAPDETQVRAMKVAPDGRSIAIERLLNGNDDVWLMDIARSTLRRLTSGPSHDSLPVFSPDGSRIAYASDPKGTLWDVFERRSDGTGAEKLLLASADNDSPEDWSPDGRYILYARQSARTDRDLWAMPLDGGKAFAVAETVFFEGSGRFSPDGHWIAFESTETGRSEVYVQPFPGPGGKIQISNGGGSQPKWPRGGRELFYVGPDSRLIAVAITARGSNIVVGSPQPLLTLLQNEDYEPTPDGQRFLVNRIVAGAPPITLVLNWREGLTSKATTAR